MQEWAVDSSGLRHAHDQGVLPLLTSPHRLTLSPMTWLPAGAPFTAATAPEIRYPDPGTRPPLTPSLFAPTPPQVELCDTIQGLYGAGVVQLAEIDECVAAATVEIEQTWKSAGGLGPLLDESVAAVLVAELGGLPLVAGDPSVLRVARHRGLRALTVTEFASHLAA
jgi:hypothetical protein